MNYLIATLLKEWFLHSFSVNTFVEDSEPHSYSDATPVAYTTPAATAATSSTPNSYQFISSASLILLFSYSCFFRFTEHLYELIYVLLFSYLYY